MNKNIKDGGPAFPVSSYVNADGETFDSSVQGMTLRDYFAAKYLQGLMAFNGGNHCRDFDIAEGCYAMADAMLKARNAQKS
jgi:hypothetical protein